MVSLFLEISFLIVIGTQCVVGDTEYINPDAELCRGVDQCAAFGGMCCEGLRGGCCVRGVCVSNSAVCKINGERCGRIRCKRDQTCLRKEPCVCCPNCTVSIPPTCRPNCGNRVCYRDEVCFISNNKRTCLKKDIDGWPIFP